MIEPRMYAAALAVYAERGWYGFSLEAAGRQAGVGQGAMYRRWSSKAALLAEAVTGSEPVLAPIDTGSTREDLIALARHFLVSYRGPAGVVGLRMVLDARTNPELAEQFEQMLTSRRAQDARAIVKRGFERGDLRAPATADLVLEVITGTTLSHVLFNARPATTSAADERFLGRLVDSLLCPGDEAGGRDG